MLYIEYNTGLLKDSEEKKAEAFINSAGTGKGGGDEAVGGKKPILVRIEPELLERITKAARRLGISRAAFIVSSTARELERME
jgi:predicted HicB family RNase H-like nuclease